MIKNKGMRSIKDNDQIIYYKTYGNFENECLFLIHPAFGDSMCFEHQIDFFIEKYYLIVIDLVGHGYSQPTNLKIKIDRSAFHISDILEVENIKTCHLIGISLGGLLAQDFADRFPNKVKSIIALGAYNIHSRDKRVKQASNQASIGLILRIMFSMKSFRAAISKLSVLMPEEQQKFITSASHFKRKSFRVMSTLSKIIAPSDSINLKCPILILYGANDIDLAKELGKSWHKDFPTSQFTCIEGSGHLANMDNPNQFNELVLAFLKKV